MHDIHISVMVYLQCFKFQQRWTFTRYNAISIKCLPNVLDLLIFFSFVRVNKHKIHLFLELFTWLGELGDSVNQPTTHSRMPPVSSLMGSYCLSYYCNLSLMLALLLGAFLLNLWVGQHTFNGTNLQLSI